MKSSKLLIVIFAVAALISSASADVPRQINFQGVLTDAGGIPLANDTTNIQFSIYSDAVTIFPTWVEFQQVITGPGGVFTVNLGAVNPLDEYLFSDSSRWLGIKVGSDPEMTPRTQIVSVAYSKRVAKAQQFGWVSSSSWADGRSLFQPDPFQFGGGIYNSSGGSAFYEVPMHLPHGATLTQVEVYGYDTDGTNELTATASEQSLSSGFGTPLGFGGSGGAFSGGNFTITIPLFQFIDNTLNAYFIELGFPASVSIFYFSYRATYFLNDAGELAKNKQAEQKIITSSQPTIIDPKLLKGSVRQ